MRRQTGSAAFHNARAAEYPYKTRLFRCGRTHFSVTPVQVALIFASALLTQAAWQWGGQPGVLPAGPESLTVCDAH